MLTKIFMILKILITDFICLCKHMQVTNTYGTNMKIYIMSQSIPVMSA